METNFKILPLVQVNLNETEIDIQSIRSLCSTGLNIDCPPEDRALAWLNLLSLYPSNPRHWETVCNAALKSYQNFKNLFLKDHNNNEFFTSAMIDSDLFHSINSDIERSVPQMLYIINKDGSNDLTEDEEQKLKNHSLRIKRILYIFAKVNSNFGYIQGFNELIIPLYYVMNSAINLFFGNIDYVEAITYQSFEFLLISSDLSEFFNLSLSICEDKISVFDQLINRYLPKVHKKMKMLNIKSVQFSFKWFNIMFSQEHPLPQLLPLWDSLLAHFNNLSLFEYCIGVARIMTVQKNIEFDYPDFKSKNSENNADRCGTAFGHVLSVLCNIQINDIHSLIKQANNIFDHTYNNDNKKKLMKHFFSRRSFSLPKKL